MCSHRGESKVRLLGEWVGGCGGLKPPTPKFGVQHILKGCLSAQHTPFLDFVCYTL
jgi:hypothetical protein